MLMEVDPDLFKQLLALSKSLVEHVEYDVNGILGKGGNGGLTSDDTLRAAGEMRILLSKITSSPGAR